MISINKTKIPREGFALLISLIVVSVVISVALTLLDLTLKQLQLSSGFRDSESAFHAANAGMECARYWRRQHSSDFEDGTETGASITCFGQAVTPFTVVDTLGTGIYRYDFTMPWPETAADPLRCSQVTMITMSSDPIDPPVTLNNVKLYIPGYTSGSKTCAPGGKCTILSVQGYNKACPTGAGRIFPIGTIQREVLLEL